MNEDFNIDDFDIFLDQNNYPDDKRTKFSKRTSRRKSSGRRQEFPTPFELMMRMAILDG